MKLLLIIGAGMSVAACQVTDPGRPHRAPVASLSNETLWSAGFLLAAMRELNCKKLSYRDAKRWLDRRYGEQERRIAARMGEREAIILTPPQCSRVRGAMENYADALRELDKRLKFGPI